VTPLTKPVISVPEKPAASALAQTVANIQAQRASGAIPTPAPAPAPQSAVAAAPQKAAFQIKPLHSVAQSKKLKIWIYGKYGSGKTTLAGSAVDVPKMRDVLLISIESGEMSLFDSPTAKLTKDIDVINITKFAELQAIRDFLIAHVLFRNQGALDKLRALQDRVIEWDGRLRQYQTVIIDSLTELDSACMQELLGIHNGFNFAGEMPAAEFKEYKQNFNKMQMLVRQFRDLDMNVILISATSWEKDETQAFHYTPTQTGKLSNAIQGFVDVVGFLSTGTATEQAAAPRRLYVEPLSGKFDAKSRLSRKPFFDNPTMFAILQSVGLPTE
jgi:hypothetical protein